MASTPHVVSPGTAGPRSSNARSSPARTVGGPRPSDRPKTMARSRPSRAGSKSAPKGGFGSSRRETDVTDTLACYLDEASRHARLTRDEEISLSAKALAGDEEAKDKLVRHNLLLVVTIAQQFARGSLDVHTLISPGNEGLIVAAGKYNASAYPGVRFSAFAANWIKQRIRRYAVEHGHLLKMPAYKGTLVRDVARAKARLEGRLGRRPTVEQIAAEVLAVRHAALDGTETAEKLRRIRLECTPEKVQEIMEALQDALELDAPLKDEGDAASYGSFLGESQSDSDQRLDQHLAQLDMQTAVRRALETLDERDARVLRWHFGLEGHPSLDLDQIALRLDVTRERARQIRAAALKRLQKTCGDALRACWD
jgi:RNA polymerase primary sigma factor